MLDEDLEESHTSQLHLENRRRKRTTTLKMKMMTKGLNNLRFLTKSTKNEECCRESIKGEKKDTELQPFSGERLHVADKKTSTDEGQGKDRGEVK